MDLISVSARYRWPLIAAISYGFGLYDYCIPSTLGFCVLKALGVQSQLPHSIMTGIAAGLLLRYVIVIKPDASATC
jgi:hypothetical protein